jgi:8-amino-3,8-dideoxy-alpha-D-manno-octulosonate transaminase
MGSVCDMDPIMAIAKKHNLKVIEDCAQACGATYKGKYVGTIGDLGCFSISAYKIIGGGEGGLLLTNNERLWERASQLVECGGLWRPTRFAPPRYEGELFCGSNYRMSELEAAIDVVQLTKVSAQAERFRSVRKRVMGKLKRYTEITPQRLNDVEGEIGYSLRFFPTTVELSEKIVAALQAEGIGASTRGKNAGPDWHISRDMFPVTMQGSPDGSGCPFNCPTYKAKGGNIEYKPGDCPVAESLYDRTVNIPINQWYSDNDCEHMAEGLNKVFNAYCSENAKGPAWY